jgi:asparagine synthase (glutamine-hydrolysing)
MSGIYGIINLKNQPVDKHQLDKMKAQLLHRGLDGNAQWLENNAGLGHLKLEITPESEYEKLPLEYKQWVITADARIDNRNQLDTPLSIQASERHKIPDTTYIVKAYEKWGQDCVKHLIGDFAFAIWDKNDKTLFCARDHIGIKPFFYLKTEDKFIFSTELKTLVELREIPVELNDSKLADWIYRIQDLHNPTDTVFKGIKRLLPAHWLSAKTEEDLFMGQYWKLERLKEPKLSNFEAYIEKLKELMIQAVECRMRTKFDMGVTLSGGLDSSSVACIAAKKLREEQKFLYTASSVLPENWDGIEEDEKEYIEAVVNQEKNIVPAYVSAEGQGAFDDLDKVFEATYLPVNAFYYMDIALDKALKKTPNLRVKLNGFYGDIALSYKGNLVFSTLLTEYNLREAVKLLYQRLRFEKSFFKVLKESLSVFLPSRLKRVYTVLKNRQHIGNNAFDIMVNNAFKEKHNLEERNKRQDIIRGNLKTVVNQINVNMKATVHYLEEMNVRNAQIGMEELNPWGDIRLLQFLVNMPLSLFHYNGWHRGAIRFAMQGIIPPKVQFRKHKTMYSPDFFHRVKNSKIELDPNDDVKNDVINVSDIQRFLLIPKLVKNSQSKEFDTSTIIFAYGFINYKFIAFCKKLGCITNSHFYIF